VCRQPTRPAKRALILLSVSVLLCVLTPTLAAHAQPTPQASQTAAEPSTEAKIAQLEAFKHKLARQARETNGYHESLRQMKIVKIDDLIHRLKNGEEVPQSKIDKTLTHMSFPLWHP
jgi:ribosomal protein L16 Arg81 hydroxylase